MDGPSDIARFKWGQNASAELQEQLADLTGPGQLDPAAATLNLVWNEPSLAPGKLLFESHGDSFGLFAADSGREIDAQSKQELVQRAEFVHMARIYLSAQCQRAAQLNPELGTPHIPHLSQEIVVLPTNGTEPVYLAMAEVREAETGDWIVIDHARRGERFEYPAWMFLSIKQSELDETIDRLGITPSYSLEAIHESLSRVKDYQKNPTLPSVMMFPSSVVSETFYFMERTLGVGPHDNLNIKSFLFTGNECSGVEYILKRHNREPERMQAFAHFTVSDYGTLHLQF